jgi:hypothetical protein
MKTILYRLGTGIYWLALVGGALGLITGVITLFQPNTGGTQGFAIIISVLISTLFLAAFGKVLQAIASINERQIDLVDLLDELVTVQKQQGSILKRIEAETPKSSPVEDVFSEVRQLIELEDLQAARERLVVLQRERANDPNLWYYISLVATNTDRRIAAARQALSLQPDHAKARQRLNALTRQQN